MRTIARESDYTRTAITLIGRNADVTVLLLSADQLRERFAAGRVCVVADRHDLGGTK